jgi:ABC-2 type transport system permease protein
MTDVYGVLIRALATRGRLIGLGILGAGAILLAIAVRASSPSDPASVAYSLIDGYGLSLLVPVVALVFSSAALGDPAEDGTLVYLWLRPLARWRLAAAAFAAALTVTVVVAVIPLVVAAALTGTGFKLVGATAVGALLAATAYSAVFCGLGLRVRRALAWGLAYLLIWEQAVARVSHGAARASLFVNTRSLTAYLADHSPMPRNAVSPLVGLVVPLAAAVVALVLTSRSLDRGEIA